VVLGQFAGIAALTAASAAAALLALAIPDGWIGLLGLAPLALGLLGLRHLRQSTAGEDDDDGEDDAASCRRGRHGGWIAVALVTIANGGDNLGVYIPLFSRDLMQIPIYAGVFAVMTAILCAAGYWMVRQPLLGGHIRRYGHVLLPFVLIGLGLVILADARALFQ
jgi:cadmium resistance protein CadD (predicted permease)